MRVGIIGLLQESNTFVSELTTLDHFRQDLLLTGDGIRQSLATAHHEIGGFLAGLEAIGWEPVPLLVARAIPHGMLTADAYAALLEQIWSCLATAGHLDGILVAAHGATVAESHADVDGHWLGQLRARVGEEVPIVGTLDPHANLSPGIVEATNAVIAYRTNPHVDQRSRGAEAAALLARILRGEAAPTQAASYPPLAINIQAQGTAESPCRPIYEQADRMRAEPGVLSNSIFLGFPYADVPEMGAATLVVTNNDQRQAERLAHRLAESLWSCRRALAGRLVSIEQALAKFNSLQPPVCLLDMGDNVGGGAPGDGTSLAQALCRHGITPAFICLCDAAAVATAQALGRGNRGEICMGGCGDGSAGGPLNDEFTVESFHSGRFGEQQPRHGGFTNYDQGPTAIVRSRQGLTVMLTSRRMVPFSLTQLTSCGIDVGDYRAVVVKGVHAPLAAYAAVCASFVHVNTPGVTCADLSQLHYQNRRRPLFPLEEECDWPIACRTDDRN